MLYICQCVELMSGSDYNKLMSPRAIHFFLAHPRPPNWTYNIYKNIQAILRLSVMFHISPHIYNNNIGMRNYRFPVAVDLFLERPLTLCQHYTVYLLRPRTLSL